LSEAVVSLHKENQRTGGGDGSCALKKRHERNKKKGDGWNLRRKGSVRLGVMPVGAGVGSLGRVSVKNSPKKKKKRKNKKNGKRERPPGVRPNGSLKKGKNETRA